MPGLVLRVVCSWCQSVLVVGDAPEPVSHTICPRCGEQWRAQTRAMKAAQAEAAA